MLDPRQSGVKTGMAERRVGAELLPILRRLAHIGANGSMMSASDRARCQNTIDPAEAERRKWGLKCRVSSWDEVHSSQPTLAAHSTHHRGAGDRVKIDLVPI